MDSPNGTGILQIGRKGKKRIQIGDGPVIEVDIVATHNQWSAIDQSFRDEKGDVPKERFKEMNDTAYQFVYQLQVGLANLPTPQAKAALEKSLSEKFSMAETLEFLKVLTEEALALRTFFEVKSPSVPDSSDTSTTLRFST